MRLNFPGKCGPTSRPPALLRPFAASHRVALDSLQPLLIIEKPESLVKVEERDLLPVVPVQEEGDGPVAQLGQLAQGHGGVALYAMVDDVYGVEVAVLPQPLFRLGSRGSDVPALDPDEDEVVARLPELLLRWHQRHPGLPLVQPALVSEGHGRVAALEARRREVIVDFLVPVLVVPEGGGPRELAHRPGGEPDLPLRCAHEHNCVHGRLEEGLASRARQGRPPLLLRKRIQLQIPPGRGQTLLARLLAAIVAARCGLPPLTRTVTTVPADQVLRVVWHLVVTYCCLDVDFHFSEQLVDL
mmetsp:Transcript_3349/g.8275  ORF Transcript_3349/g.8275 Transcript_3349/m.8275 type:complete len:300 (-) Transcript_3349:744-1643(-)